MRALALPDGGLFLTNVGRFEGPQVFRVSQGACNVVEDGGNPAKSGGYEIAADASGAVHLAQLQSNGRFEALAVSTLQGGTWGTPAVLSAASIDVLSFFISRNDEGEVSVAWLEGGQAQGQERPRIATFDGASWREELVSQMPTLRGFDTRCLPSLALAGGMSGFRDFRRSLLYQSPGSWASLYECVSAASPEGSAAITLFQVGEDSSGEVHASLGFRKPGAPRDVTADASDARVMVSWELPAEVAGLPITGYTVTSTPSSRTCITSGFLTCTVTGLTNGTSYTFAVTATNAVGTSQASVPSQPVTPRSSSSTPGAVRNLKAKTSRGLIRVSWSPPASAGGTSALTYEYRTGRQPWKSASGTQVAVRGKSGVEITVHVRAVNGAGPGLSSRISATPR